MFSRRTLILFGILSGFASLGVAATRYVQEPQLEACGDWESVEQAVWDGKIDRKEARKRFQSLWSQVTIDDLPPLKEGLWQWDFPVPGYGEDSFSAQSYAPDPFKFYDGPKAEGRPGVNIYIRDNERKGLDERNGKAAPVVSCTDGVVVSARKFWNPSDANPLGVYVSILCQDEKRLFYYCNLSKLRVSTGEVVDKGEVIGWVGRSGKDTVERNLGTHLRFEVFSFDQGLFYPVFPARALREAKQLPWPLPEPEYRKIPKQRYEIERLPGMEKKIEAEEKAAADNASPTANP